jgi:hypothetical protein
VSSALDQHAVWIDVFTSCEQNVILQTNTSVSQLTSARARTQYPMAIVPYVLKDLADKAWHGMKDREHS